MATYFYNGVRLPGFSLDTYKGEVAGALIYEESGAYYLVKHPNYSYKNFTLNKSLAYDPGDPDMVNPACNTDVYRIENGEWVYHKSVYALLGYACLLSSVVCTNYDIYYDDGTLAFAGTPFDLFQITAFGWTDGIGDSYSQGTIEMYYGWSLSAVAKVEVYVPDYASGTITVEWYENGTKVRTNQFASDTFSSKYIPGDIGVPGYKLEIGTYNYYCIITDGTTSCQSDTLTLNVVADDSGGGNPGGSGGGTPGGGDPDPGIPDDGDPDDGVEVTEELLRRAFWQGFAAGVGTIHKVQAPQEPEIIATFENGVLYIKKAPATLKDGVLEVGKND